MLQLDKSTEPIEISPLTPKDAEWLGEFFREQWRAPFVVAHGKKFFPHEVAGLVAMRDEQVVGVITFQIRPDECEIVTLNSLQPNGGVGGALMNAVVERAKTAGCRRAWLTTSNDNMNALRFYQKRGFEIVAVYRHALDVARALKPEIPLLGEDGIPLRDEIELEMILSSDEQREHHS